MAGHFVLEEPWRFHSQKGHLWNQSHLEMVNLDAIWAESDDACCQSNPRFESVCVTSVVTLPAKRWCDFRASLCMVSLMPVLASLKASAWCCWMGTTAPPPVVCSSVPVHRAPPQAARAKQRDLQVRDASCVWIVSFYSSALCSPVTLRSPVCQSPSWAWLVEPTLTCVTSESQVWTVRMQAGCRPSHGDFGLENEFSFWSILRVGSVETFLALPDDLHCGFSASNSSDFNIPVISQSPEECKGQWQHRWWRLCFQSLFSWLPLRLREGEGFLLFFRFPPFFPYFGGLPPHLMTLWLILLPSPCILGFILGSCFGSACIACIFLVSECWFLVLGIQH